MPARKKAAKKKAAAKRSKSKALVVGGSTVVVGSKEADSLLAQYRGMVNDRPAAKVAPTGLPKISVRGGTAFKLGENDLGDEIDVVVIGWAHENRYYGKKGFDPKNPRGVECYALGLDADEMAAPAGVAIAETCLACDYNAFGSDPRPGSRGKACKNQVRLAVVDAVSLREGVALDALQPNILMVPVTSVKRWGKYLQTLEKVAGDLAPTNAITRVSVSPENQVSLYFTFSGELLPVDTTQALLKVAEDQDAEIFAPPALEAGGRDEPQKGSRKGARRRASA